MIYGFSPRHPEVAAMLIERGLPCRRRGCDCAARLNESRRDPSTYRSKSMREAVREGKR